MDRLFDVQSHKDGYIGEGGRWEDSAEKVRVRGGGRSKEQGGRRIRRVREENGMR